MGKACKIMGNLLYLSQAKQLRHTLVFCGKKQSIHDEYSTLAHV